jgi:hypothetical protein
MYTATDLIFSDGPSIIPSSATDSMLELSATGSPLQQDIFCNGQSIKLN